MQLPFTGRRHTHAISFYRSSPHACNFHLQVVATRMQLPFIGRRHTHATSARTWMGSFCPQESGHDARQSAGDASPAASERAHITVLHTTMPCIACMPCICASLLKAKATYRSACHRAAARSRRCLFHASSSVARCTLLSLALVRSKVSPSLASIGEHMLPVVLCS